MKFGKGDLVSIDGQAGRVPIATCFELCALEDLPVGIPYARLVLRWLNEDGFTHIALLSHPFRERSGREITVTFVALLDRAGRWTDQNGQRLTITRLFAKEGQ